MWGELTEGPVTMASAKTIVPVGKIQQRILLIRGVKMMIDADLAVFHSVPTRRLNEQVKRNRARFPVDFMFRLTADEKREVIASCDHLANLEYPKVLPYAFSEHGAIMAASVLNSERGVEVSVFVVRAFVKLRQAIAGHAESARKISQLERRLADHDKQIVVLVKAIKQLASPAPVSRKRRIGSQTDEP